jgi:hypothetical protein
MVEGVPEYFGRVELLQGGGGARRAPDTKWSISDAVPLHIDLTHA